MKRKLSTLLTKYDQTHLLRFWDALDRSQRAMLAEEIGAIDFDQIQRLRKTQTSKDRFRELAEQASDPTTYRLEKGGKPFSPNEAKQRGEKALADGHIGVVLVAGGQGTRLEFDHPKGIFPIGPISEKSLFQIHVEKIVARSHRYGKPIPLALMTSQATHDETLAYFETHDGFGIPTQDRFVFCQGTMPAVDEQTGKLLLEDRHHLALSPDGHGGMLRAIVESGTLARLRDRGIQHLFYFQVDNPFVDIANPEFLGYHLLARSELSSQVIHKQTPYDRVGNVVEVNDRLHVIEYSDLDEKYAEKTRPDGRLSIWAGSIAVHVFDLGFLERMIGEPDALPFHIAKKKVKHIDSAGQLIEPKTENALKFERFIFDLLPSAQNAIVVEVDPAEHFGPLKNGSCDSAIDTPETVRAQMVRLHTHWLRRAGIEVRSGVTIEISPLFALDVDEFATRVIGHAPIKDSHYFH